MIKEIIYEFAYIDSDKYEKYIVRTQELDFLIRADYTYFFNKSIRLKKN